MSSLKTSPVLKLKIAVDLPRLKETLESVSAFEKIHPEYSSVALMQRPGAVDPWMDGVAPYLGDKTSETGFSESSFNQPCPGLEQTYFAETVSRIQAEVNNPLGRIRLFKRMPLTSSSAHVDFDVRFHIPIVTNENSYLVFPEIGVFHLPADGSIYLIDTTRLHFAVNTHRNSPRFHMIINTYCGFKETREMHGEVLKFAKAFFAEFASSSKSLPVLPLSANS